MSLMTFRPGALALTVLAGLTGPVVAAEIDQSVSIGTGVEWAVPGGDPEATRYSRLSEIKPSNVGKLVEEFSFQTGSTGNHEGQPLVVGSVMYIVTPFPHTLIALDLKNPGKTLWTYVPPSTYAAKGVACCDAVNRGPTYASGKIIFNTLDDNTIAVNATTGALLWSVNFGQPSSGMTMTGAPIVADKVVIVGNAGGEFGVRGWIAGLDLNTGNQLWKAYSTGPDTDVLIGSGFHAFYKKDQGTNLGETSWPGTLWQQGGGAVWSWITYDPETDLIFYGTSNPGVWNPTMRPGDNKWGATIFARKPKTGAAVWAYQVTPHDGWDFDATSEPVPVDLPVGGTTRKLLVQFNKNGFAYTLDRTTGQVLVANPFTEVTWATSISSLGTPKVVSAKVPHQGDPVSDVCPSPLGGKDQEPSAFSPRTNLFYVPSINLCDNIEALKAVYVEGAPFQGAASTIIPGSTANGGALIAWDPVKGKEAWSVPETLPLLGGAMVTEGGVVFYGTLDKKFKAVNATTGKVLFQTTVECGIASNPISYQAPDGKQRIAIMSGIGWLAGGFAGGSCPAVGTGASGVVHVFKLP